MDRAGRRSGPAAGGVRARAPVRPRPEGARSDAGSSRTRAPPPLAAPCSARSRIPQGFRSCEGASGGRSPPSAALPGAEAPRHRGRHGPARPSHGPCPRARRSATSPASRSRPVFENRFFRRLLLPRRTGACPRPRSGPREQHAGPEAGPLAAVLHRLGIELGPEEAIRQLGIAGEPADEPDQPPRRRARNRARQEGPAGGSPVDPARSARRTIRSGAAPRQRRAPQAAFGGVLPARRRRRARRARGRRSREVLSPPRKEGAGRSRRRRRTEGAGTAGGASSGW